MYQPANYVVSGKQNLQLQKNGLAAGLYNVMVATDKTPV